MSKIAVVYWSGTGNTEAMAEEVANGAKAAGAEVESFTTDDFAADKMNDYDAVAFGCPAMGDEVLEEDEFGPLFEDCSVRFLRMGRRRMDEKLGRRLQNSRCNTCL